MKAIKKENIVTQSLDFSCGAAGMSTLMNFYLGETVSEEEIINEMLNLVSLDKVIERRGFSLLDLKTFAESRGYKVTGYKMDANFLRNLRQPVLVPINFRSYSHFVIVKGIYGDRVFIADPASGNMSMKISKFLKMWHNGIGLVIEDEDADPDEQYALKINEDDLVMNDYRRLNRLLTDSLLRTAVFPSEF